MEGVDKISPDPAMKGRRAKPHKDRSLKILKIISTLKHACECSDPACSRLDCDSMKGMVVHSKVCNRKPRSGCHSCRQLIALCRYHAKRSRDCESVQCVVPFCGEIKFLFHKKKAGKLANVPAQNSAAGSSTGGWDVQEAAPRVGGSMTTDGGQALWGLGEGGENSAEQPFMPEPAHASYSDAHLAEALGPFEHDIFAPTQEASSTSQSQTDNQSPTVQRREQLRVLLHANKCQNRPAQNGFWGCRVANCNTMKDVLKHILQCQVLTGCTAPHCVSSKKVINHWQQCVSIDCQFCAPLRHHRTPAQPQNPQPMNLTATTPRVCCLPAPEVPRRAPPMLIQPASSLQRPDIGAPDNNLAATSATASGVTKEWHRSITMSLRTHLVHKIAQSFTPTLGGQMAGWRHQLLAEQMEDETYRLANSRAEYYHMIAEKIYAIQTGREISTTPNHSVAETNVSVIAPSAPDSDPARLYERVYPWGRPGNFRVPVDNSPRVCHFGANISPAHSNIRPFVADGRFIPQATEVVPPPVPHRCGSISAAERQQHIERLTKYHPEMMEIFRKQRERRLFRERRRAICQFGPLLTPDSDLQTSRTPHYGDEGTLNTNQ